MAATSSSVAFNGPASKAIDGKANGGRYDPAVCAHTSQKASWIKLDLGTPRDVTSLQASSIAPPHLYAAEMWRTFIFTCSPGTGCTRK